MQITDSKLPPDARLDDLIHSGSDETLKAVAGDARLTEELALAMLERRAIPHSVLEALARNRNLAKSRPVMNAIVAHPRAPRFVSLPLARRLYTFELMQVALTPAIAADVKIAIEAILIERLESISSGERLTLARRASTSVAGALLLDPEPRVSHAALDNPLMTEAQIVRGLMKDEAPPHFVDAACRHAKWSLRTEVRMALLRNRKTPFGRVLHFAQEMSARSLREVLATSRLSENVKQYLEKQLASREEKAGPKSQTAKT